MELESREPEDKVQEEGQIVMKSKSIYWKILSVFFGFVFIMTFFSKSFYNYRLPDVVVTNPESGELDFGIKGTGTVNYAGIDTVYPELDGIIRNIYVHTGDQVKKGQKIMQMQIPDRNRRKMITAARDGMITAVDVEKGMYVSYMMNQSLYKIAKLSGKWETALLLTEEEADGLKKGDVANIRLASQEVTLKGKVDRITPYANETFSGYQVIIRFRLREISVAYERADVSIEKESPVYDSLIPAASLHDDASGYYVFTLQKEEGVSGEGYRVERVSVDLLCKDKKYCAVEGLEDYEVVVITATKKIRDGDPVYYNQRP